MIKTFRYLLLKQKYELLTCIFAITSIVVIEYLNWSYIWSIIIVLLSTTIIIYLRVRDKSFYYISLKQRKQKDDWIGNGEFNYSRHDNSFLITNSDSGFIFTKCLIWNNYSFSFKFKIIKDCLGIIIRAVNLSNYIMLQINQRTNGIRPHIRINSGWKVWEAKESGLNFEKALSLDNWYKCNISCDNRFINIMLATERGNQELFNRKWQIPLGNLLFKFISENNENKIDIPYSITLDYGTIGFRNSGEEKALVKEILMKKI